MSCVKAMRQNVALEKPVWTIASHRSVAETLNRFIENRVGALIVTSTCDADGSDIVGIVTERDVLKHLKMSNFQLQDDGAKVTEIMTPASRVVYVQPSDTRQTAVDIMKARKIRHLPVVDGNKRLVGIVSPSDLISVQPRAETTQEWASQLHPMGLMFVQSPTAHTRDRVVTKWTR